MRKLLWLVPVFFLLPAAVGMAHLYWWFLTGSGFIPHFSEAHGVLASVGAFIALISAVMADTANS